MNVTPPIDMKAIVEKKQKNIKKTTNEKPNEKEPKETKQKTEPKPKETTKKTDNAAKRQSLILLLKSYGESKRFGEFLKANGFKLDVKTLNTMKLDKLQDILDQVKITVSSKNINFMAEKAVLSMTKLLEAGLTNIYNIDGLSENLARNDSFLDCVEELRLEHQVFIKVDPKQRFLFEILRTAYMTHTANKLMGNLTNGSRKKINERCERTHEKTRS